VERRKRRRNPRDFAAGTELASFVQKSGAGAFAMTLAHVRYVTVAAILAGTTGCRAIGDIFKAGVWVGVVVVGFVIALIFGLTRLFAGR